MSKKALLIFSKNPEAGNVKTRLAATIGNEAALAVYHQLLLHAVSVTAYLPVDKFVYYSNYIEQEDVWHSEHYYKQVQQGVDLGERMKNAFAAAFQNGYEKVLIIGTDCPHLDAEMLMKAFMYLQSHDAVIGPAEDGGYYLLGMKQLYPDLFGNIQWSTHTVLNDTLKLCDKLKLTYRLLPVLNDIDDEKDLQAFKLKAQ